MRSWYMMRVHRAVEKIRNKLDWTVETWIRLFLAQRCIYTYTLITEVNRKINLLSWASMNTAYYNLGLSQGGIFSLELELVHKLKLIEYHGFKAFSRKQQVLNKLKILVVLLCPLNSIVYAVFKKHKNNQNGLNVSICEHMHEHFIFFAALKDKLNQWS